MKLVRYGLFILLNVPFFAETASSQQGSNDTLYYFNSDLLSANTFFALPGKYGVTSGTDTTRTVIGYSERFSCPYANTFLDSVSVLITLDSLVSNDLAIEAVPVTWTNGHPYADLNNPYNLDLIDSVSHKDTASLNSYAMYHTQITDTNFFVSAVTYDQVHTISFLWSDSIMYSTPFSSIDEDRDRSRLVLDTPYGANPAYQYYLAGRPHILAGTPPDTLYWYPNFVMIAYVSSPAGSVAEMYPAAVDPLTFYVEWMPNGETNLHFTTQDAGPARLDLFDASGRLVSTLFDAGVGPGDYDIPLVTTGLANGMYFAKLSAADVIETRRIAVSR